MAGRAAGCWRWRWRRGWAALWGAWVSWVLAVRAAPEASWEDLSAGLRGASAEWDGDRSDQRSALEPWSGCGGGRQGGGVQTRRGVWRSRGPGSTPTSAPRTPSPGTLEGESGQGEGLACSPLVVVEEAVFWRSWRAPARLLAQASSSRARRGAGQRMVERLGGEWGRLRAASGAGEVGSRRGEGRGKPWEP